MNWLYITIITVFLILILERFIKKEIKSIKYNLPLASILSVCFSVFLAFNISDLDYTLDRFLILSTLYRDSILYWDISLLIEKTSLLIISTLFLGYSVLVKNAKSSGILTSVALMFCSFLALSKNIETFGLFVVLIFFLLGTRFNEKSYFVKLITLSFTFITLSGLIDKTTFFQLEVLNFANTDNIKILTLLMTILLLTSFTFVLERKRVSINPFNELFLKPTCLAIFILKFGNLIFSFNILRYSALVLALLIFLITLLSSIGSNNKQNILYSFVNTNISLILLFCFLGANDLILLLLMTNNLIVAGYLIVLDIYKVSLRDEVISSSNKGLAICLGVMSTLVLAFPGSPLFLIYNKLFNRLIQSEINIFIVVLISLSILMISFRSVDYLVALVKTVRGKGEIDYRLSVILVPISVCIFSIGMIPSSLSSESADLLVRLSVTDYSLILYPELQPRIATAILVSIIFYIIIKIISFSFLVESRFFKESISRFKIIFNERNGLLKDENLASLISSSFCTFSDGKWLKINSIRSLLINVVVYPFNVLQSFISIKLSNTKTLSFEVLSLFVFALITMFIIMFNEFKVL